MITILLLFDNPENRDVLHTWLQTDYILHNATSEQSLETEFDICIVDAPALQRYSDAIAQRRAAEAPHFLPLLLVSQESQLSLPHHLWPLVDEVIKLWPLIDTSVKSPVEKRELRLHIETLLRIRRLSLELAERNEELQRAVQVRDVFMDLAAHEIKNPLTIMIGQVSLLQRGVAQQGTLDERGLRRIDAIGAQARRLNILIGKLFDLSSIERGQLYVARQPMDLQRFVRRIVEDTQSVFSEHTFRLDIDTEPIMIMGDEQRLEQVLTNLLNNAAKYSPPGSTITTTLKSERDNACLSVRDEGVGIPKNQLAHIFERFRRLQSSENHHTSGLGVGLYVVHEVVGLHGGTITVESEEGNGSTFTICLPCNIDEMAESQATVTTPVEQAQSA